MSGISGIVQYNQENVCNKRIESMINSMKHRGPNGRGYYTANNISLGCVFLDDSNSASTHTLPITDKGERYTIVFNGKIYNYAELHNR